MLPLASKLIFPQLYCERFVSVFKITFIGADSFKFFNIDTCKSI